MEIKDRRVLAQAYVKLTAPPELKERAMQLVDSDPEFINSVITFGLAFDRDLKEYVNLGMRISQDQEEYGFVDYKPFLKRYVLIFRNTFESRLAPKGVPGKAA